MSAPRPSVLSNAGLTLTEVIISVGIATALFAGFAEVSTRFAKSSRSVSADLSIQQTAAEVAAFLSNKAGCDQSDIIGRIFDSGAPSTTLLPLNGAGGTVLRAGKGFVDGWDIQSFTIDRTLQDLGTVAPGRRGHLARARLVAVQSGSHGTKAKETFVKDFYVRLQTDAATNEIRSCSFEQSADNRRRQVCDMVGGNYVPAQGKCEMSFTNEDCVMVRVSPPVYGSGAWWTGPRSADCPIGKYVAGFEFTQYRKSGGDRETNGLSMWCCGAKGTNVAGGTTNTMPSDPDLAALEACDTNYNAAHAACAGMLPCQATARNACLNCYSMVGVTPQPFDCRPPASAAIEACDTNFQMTVDGCGLFDFGCKNNAKLTCINCYSAAGVSPVPPGECEP